MNYLKKWKNIWGDNMSIRTEDELLAMEKELDLIKCRCKYYNKRKNVEIYGTCRGCGRVLDLKAKYAYELRQKKGRRY